MVSEVKAKKERAEYLAAAGEMYDQLRQWREEHPTASIDDIAGQVSRRRRELMGELLNQLACQHGNGEVIEGVVCPDCGGAMLNKGVQQRGMVHSEGETKIERMYYYCSECKTGIFPPG